MKKTLLLLALCTTARADDVALLDIRFEDGTKGQAVIEFYENDAPETVANFKKLAEKGFFKGCAFHRAIPTAIVQTGDPLSKKKDRTAVGTGGPGYTLAPEIRRRHTKGAVAAARIGDKVNPQRRSNGSQFYICISPQSQLDGKYTVFGNVISGLDVLETISNRSADTNDYPLERITLKKVSIIPREKVPGLPPAPAAPAAKPSVVKPPVTKPAVAKPAVTKPPVTKPAVKKPFFTNPFAAKPVATEPVATKAPAPVAKPSVAKPAVSTPAVTKPAAKKPFFTNPFSKKSVATKPVATEPVATKPVATKPVATKPAAPVAKPSVIRPAVTKPAAAQPTVTKPFITKPATTPEKKPLWRRVLPW